MSISARWRRFWKRRARRRRAQRMLGDLFDRPDLRQMSSLRPAHRSRAVFLGYEAEEDEIVLIRFGLVRHPRPLPLRGVSHEVIEIYAYDVKAETVDVEASHNITTRGRPAGEADEDGSR